MLPMKRLLSLLLALALMLSLFSLGALADSGLDTGTLFEPGESSQTGELSVDWSPESLDDEPYLYTYDETAAFGGIAMFALAPAALEDDAALDGGYPVYVPDYSDGSGYDPRQSGGVTLPIRDQGALSTCWSLAALSCAELNGLKEGLLTGTPNLSEWHLEYFARKGFTDTLGNTGRDRHTLAPFSGGNPFLSVMTLANWVGPADETATNTAYSSISTSGTLADNIALESVMHLETAYWLSMAGEEDWNALKQLIRSQGGAVLCFNYSDSFYSSDHTSYYCPDDTLKTNHEVTVVGWDDNFPADYFSTTAPGKGAWLCRNSRGESWGDGGYFWLSYYDAVLRASTAAAFDFGSASNYDNNYQYDGTAVYSYVQASNLDTYANIFTAKANDGGHEQLQAVATFSYSPGITYSYKVYTSLTSASDPTSGTLAASGSGTFPYAGYYTIPLSSPVDLYEGQSYSVVFTIGKNSQDICYIPTCSTNSNWSSVNSIAAGESFILLGGTTWSDMTTVTDRSGNVLNANVRIKAFTENKNQTVTISLEPGNADLTEYSLQLAWGQAPGDRLATPSLSGYDFQGWYTPSGTAFAADTRVFESLTLSARWLRSWNDPFTDVISADWFYGNVRYCYQNELFNGLEDDLFGASENATRGQIVTVLHRLAGQPEATESLRFDDVSLTAYYSSAIRWAAEAGIVQGSDDDGDSVYSFRPNQYVTRQDFILMLYRYAKYMGDDTASYENASLDSFSDLSSIADYALTAEKWSVGCGLQNGSGGKLLPTAQIYRSEVAALLSRYDGYTTE